MALTVKCTHQMFSAIVYEVLRRNCLKVFRQLRFFFRERLNVGIFLVPGEVAPAPVPQDDRSLSFQCCTAGVRKVAQKPLAALIQRLGSQGEGPVGIGDLVRVPSATVSELGSGTVLDLDDARDLSIGKVVEVNDHRFLPLCILFPNGVLRWSLESSW